VVDIADHLRTRRTHTRSDLPRKQNFAQHVADDPAWHHFTSTQV
jgi:hypothetical protein